MAEQAAGPSSGTTQDAAGERAAAKGDSNAPLEPKHDHARGAGHGPLAGDDEEQQRAAQQQGEEQQREAQQHKEEQQREAQRVPASGARCGAGAATAAATANEAAAGGCDGPVLKQASVEARLRGEVWLRGEAPHGEAWDEPTKAARKSARKNVTIMKKKKKKKKK
jgi:hypothetical protein